MKTTSSIIERYFISLGIRKKTSYKNTPATVRDEIHKSKDVMVISFPTLVPMIKRVNINKTKNGFERSFEGADNQNFTVLSIIPSPHCPTTHPQ